MLLLGAPSTRPTYAVLIEKLPAIGCTFAHAGLGAAVIVGDCVVTGATRTVAAVAVIL